MVLFESNSALLNIYSEHKEPRKMFRQVINSHIIIIVLTLFVGLMSYMAFGSAT